MTIADGHHRYETALRYRDERRMSRSCEEDPAFDYLLMLFLEATGEPLTVLPTHRIVRGLGDDGVGGLLGRPGRAVRGRRAPTADDAARRVRRRPRAGAAATAGSASGRATGGAILTARRAAFEPFLPRRRRRAARARRHLLGAALERLAGIDAAAVAAGRGSATRSPRPRRSSAVDAGRDGADAAFLLEPTPVASIAAVAPTATSCPRNRPTSTRRP